MREILFRGKRIDNGEWVYGVPVPVYINSYYDNRIEMTEYQNYDDDYAYEQFSKAEEVIPETVGQFTGILDKNDNKIFEGDIIKFINGRLLDVRFNGETLQWELTDVGVPDWEVNHLHNTLPLSELEVETCYGEMTSEIVGNIHDNPELLKKEILSEKYKEFYEKKKAITERLRKDNEDF